MAAVGLLVNKVDLPTDRRPKAVIFSVAYELTEWRLEGLRRLTYAGCERVRGVA